MTGDVWADGQAYERYVGRWSRPIATAFVRWLDVPPGRRWLDVGCGTGALTGTVLTDAGPASVVGVDPSEGFLAVAREQVPGATFRVGAADALPDGPFDVVVSGLALNFTPSPEAAVAEFRRVTAPGGVAAAYVWDYAEGMEMMRYFWDAAASVHPAAADVDESRRFPICHPEALTAAWTSAGLTDVEVRPIEVPTVFTDFDDYWTPFLGGQGAAPAYLATMPETERDAVRDLLRFQVPSSPDGTIVLTATAWAVRGGVKVG